MKILIVHTLEDTVAKTPYITGYVGDSIGEHYRSYSGGNPKPLNP